MSTASESQRSNPSFWERYTATLIFYQPYSPASAPRYRRLIVRSRGQSHISEPPTIRKSAEQDEQRCLPPRSVCESTEQIYGCRGRRNCCCRVPTLLQVAHERRRTSCRIEAKMLGDRHGAQSTEKRLHTLRRQMEHSYCVYVRENTCCQ
jgi:hypothetical protein